MRPVRPNPRCVLTNALLLAMLASCSCGEGPRYPAIGSTCMGLNTLHCASANGSNHVIAICNPDAGLVEASNCPTGSDCKEESLYDAVLCVPGGRDNRIGFECPAFEAAGTVRRALLGTPCSAEAWGCGLDDQQELFCQGGTWTLYRACVGCGAATSWDETVHGCANISCRP